MKNNDGANRRSQVDEIVKGLTNNKVDVNQVTATLMKNYRVLDNNSIQERDALKEVVASNVLLAKTVGTLVTEVAKMQREIELLKRNKR